MCSLVNTLEVLCWGHVVTAGITNTCTASIIWVTVSQCLWTDCLGGNVCKQCALIIRITIIVPFKGPKNT